MSKLFVIYYNSVKKALFCTSKLGQYWPFGHYSALDRSHCLINCLTPQHEKSDDIEKKEPFKEELFDVLYKNHGRWGSFRSERTNNDDVTRFHVICEKSYLLQLIFDLRQKRFLCFQKSNLTGFFSDKMQEQSAGEPKIDNG